MENLMKKMKKKAQSTVEYAVIIGIAVSAAVAMQTYIKRGLQARAKSGVDALTQPSYTFSVSGLNGVSAEYNALTQYEPYYLESQYNTYSGSAGTRDVSDDYQYNMKSADISVRGTGGFQKSHGYTDERKELADNLFTN